MLATPLLTSPIHDSDPASLFMNTRSAWHILLVSWKCCAAYDYQLRMLVSHGAYSVFTVVGSVIKD